MIHNGHVCYDDQCHLCASRDPWGVPGRSEVAAGRYAPWDSEGIGLDEDDMEGMHVVRLLPDGQQIPDGWFSP